MPVKLLKIDEARTEELHDGFLENWFFDQDTPTDRGRRAMATIVAGRVRMVRDAARLSPAIGRDVAQAP